MAKQLESYVEGRWVQGSGEGTPIINPTTEGMIAETSTAGIDFEAALQHARQGGAALRQMTFAERGTLLGDLAKAIHEYRAELVLQGPWPSTERSARSSVIVECLLMVIWSN